MGREPSHALSQTGSPRADESSHGIIEGPDQGLTANPSVPCFETSMWIALLGYVPSAPSLRQVAAGHPLTAADHASYQTPFLCFHTGLRTDSGPKDTCLWSGLFWKRSPVMNTHPQNALLFSLNLFPSLLLGSLGSKTQRGRSLHSTWQRRK